MPKSNFKHDLAITNASDVEIGLTLARRGGKPVYAEINDPALATQFFSGNAEYGRMPPEKEIRLVQDDSRGGAGLEYAGFADDKKYHYTIECDGRFADGARLGPDQLTVTKPTVTTLTIGDAGMELNDGSWTGTGTSQSAVQAHTGTYSWSIGTNNKTAVQDIASGTFYKGKRYGWKIWYYRASGGAGNSTVSIADGVETSTSAALTADGTWRTITVYHNVNPGATKLELQANNSNDGQTLYIDDAELIQPTVGEINSQADFGKERYTTYGNILTRLNAAGTAYDYVWNSAEVNQLTQIYPSNVSGTDYLFILQGWADDYWYMADTLINDCDTVWTESVDGDVTATADTADKERGIASLSLEAADGLAAGDIMATEAITSVNLSAYEAITLWVKSTTALVAGDIQFLMDDTAKCASITKALDIPAIAANAWTSVQLQLGDASGLTAIISIGIKMVNDKGVFTLNVDEIRALNFTQTDITGAELKQIVEINGVFHGSNTNSTLMSTIAPLASGTNWGTSKQMGEDNYDIVDLLKFENLPYVKKSDCKVYYLDSSGNVQVLVNAEENIEGTNTYPMFVWREEALIIPYGLQGLLHYDGTTITHISPSLYLTNTIYHSGQIQGVAGDTHYLYIAVDYSTRIEILSARQETVNGTTDWRFHPIAKTGTVANCASIGISSVYKKRLWVGSAASANSFYFFPTTTKYGDIDDDTDYLYQDGGELYTPGFHLNFRGDDKAWIKMTLTQGHAFDTDIYWECHYKKLDDSAYTDIGDFKGSSSTKITTIYLPVDGSSVKPFTEIMFFKFVGKTDDTSKTPILLSFDVQAVWYPTERKLIACQIRVEDNLPISDEVRDDQLGSDIKSTLDGINSSTWPRAFYPPYWKTSADTIYVKKLPIGAPELDLIRMDKEQNPQYVYNLLLEKITLS